MTTTHFEWDPNKDLENQQKHDVAFTMAQYDFADPHTALSRKMWLIASRSNDITVSAKWAAVFSLFGLPTAKVLFAS